MIIIAVFEPSWSTDFDLIIPTMVGTLAACMLQAKKLRRDVALL
jgi:hypothetical protein